MSDALPPRVLNQENLKRHAILRRWYERIAESRELPKPIRSLLAEHGFDLSEVVARTTSGAEVLAPAYILLDSHLAVLDLPSVFDTFPLEIETLDRITWPVLVLRGAYHPWQATLIGYVHGNLIDAKLALIRIKDLLPWHSREQTIESLMEGDGLEILDTIFRILANPRDGLV